MDEWDLHRVFEVNTIGVFLLMQSAARVMRQQGGGLILNLLATRSLACLRLMRPAARQWRNLPVRLPANWARLVSGFMGWKKAS